MSEGSRNFQQRLYPIGALPEKDVVAIFTDPLCAEEITIDELMNEWRAKSRTFESMTSPTLEVTDSELLPIGVTQEVMSRVESTLLSYRYYLPATFDLAFVPIQKLICPQISVVYDHAHNSLNGAQNSLSDDENALACLGSPNSPHQIEAAFLGIQSKAPPFNNSSSYLYQFSSEDPNMRFIPLMPLKPLRDMNLASEGAPFSYDVKAIPVAVGLGLPIVHILKVPTGIDTATQAVLHRLVIANGIHRIFRLAELGNTHVAALVQTVKHEDVPNPMVDVPRETLFSQRPLTISTLANSNVSRLFNWKKSKRVIKLQVTVTQEVSYVV